MHDNNLIKLLKTFSQNEFREFYLLVNSPFFNREKVLMKFSEILKKHYPGFVSANLDKKKIFINNVNIFFLYFILCLKKQPLAMEGPCRGLSSSSSQRYRNMYREQEPWTPIPRSLPSSPSPLPLSLPLSTSLSLSFSSSLPSLSPPHLSLFLGSIEKLFSFFGVLKMG